MIMSLLDRCILCVTDKLRGTDVTGPEGLRVRAIGVAALEVGIEVVIMVVISDSIRMRLAGGSRAVMFRSSPTESSLSLLRTTPCIIRVPEVCGGTLLPTSRWDFPSGEFPSYSFDPTLAYLYYPGDGLGLLGGLHSLPGSRLFWCGIRRIRG